MVVRESDDAIDKEKEVDPSMKQCRNKVKLGAVNQVFLGGRIVQKANEHFNPSPRYPH